MRTLPLALLCAAVLALPACGMLPEKQTIAVYAPMPTIPADATWPQVRWQLQIPRPTADVMLDSARIAVRPLPGELQVYKGALWSQAAPDLLHTSLMRGFEDSGKITGVTRRGEGVAGDFLLLLDIRRFDADYAGGAIPQARIEVSAKLVKPGDNLVVAQRLFAADTQAAATDIASVSRAFEQSLARVDADIIGWTLREGQRAFR